MPHTSSSATPAHALRERTGHGAKVTNVELFFDLVYVFAVTQLSHLLLAHLTPLGAAQTLLLWFAVWLGWQYTCWVTNWFDPETLSIRVLLFAIMGVGLVMAVALPQAFGARGLVFAACYVLIQVGRTLWVLVRHLGGSHALSANFRRILGWLVISGVFWIAGGLAEDGTVRLALWAVAVACEYVSPMVGFRLPGLGRSRTEDWTIDGGHLIERCQLFVIIALGESILVTGATFGEAHWEWPTAIAFAVAFLASLAMWWLYFDLGSRQGAHLIEHSDDPGRLGAYFHYVHVLIVAGVIVAAVGAELMIAHPDGPAKPTYAAVLVGGPALYLLGNALYKRAVYGRLPLSHLAGLAALVVLAAVAGLTDLLMVGGLATLLLVGVAGWESLSRRGAR